MVIKLLEQGYKNNEDFYKAFLDNTLWESEFVSEEAVWINKELPDFPIFFAIRDREEREKQFIHTIKIIADQVISMDRDIYMDERFWHSWLCLYKREYLLELYPQVKDGLDKFENIIIKPFDWENYIYKAILIAQYTVDNKPVDEREAMYHTILQNFDMFNYIIKYEIFRNGQFLINVMDIVEETGLSKVLKAKIKDRPDLGKDQRYGRRVIFEFNKSYPIVLGPMLEKEELKKYFMKFLSYYYQENDEVEEVDSEEF